MDMHSQPISTTTSSVRDADSDRETVQQMRGILEQRHEERITLTDLGHEMNLSPFQTLRVFQRHLGITPHQYLLRYRVEKARLLLCAGEPIAEVAAQVGFTDQSHMTKHFKRLLGTTPSRYRASGGIDITRAPIADLA